MLELRNLANNLLDIRTESHQSQDNFASACGVSKETVSLIERNVPYLNPTLGTLQAFGAFSGLTVVQLLSARNSLHYKMDKCGFNYCVVNHEQYSRRLGRHIIYGIGVFKTPVCDDLEISVVDFNVTTYKSVAKHIVDALNKYDASPIHFADFVEDLYVVGWDDYNDE